MLNFSESAESFAAARTDVLNDAVNMLRPVVASALDSGTWTAVTDKAVELFRRSANEFDPDVKVKDDDPLLQAALIRLVASLRKTAPTRAGSQRRSTQEDAICEWVATMFMNAGTEMAVVRHKGQAVLQWVTMGDEDVRPTHRQMDGRYTTAGRAFNVEGFDVAYPGEPIGPPHLWIRCRCTVRPARLKEAAIVAAAETDVDPAVEGQDDPVETPVIVALPAENDPVNRFGTEVKHATILFFGDQTVDKGRLEDIVSQVRHEPFTADVVGRQTLGDEGADVLMLQKGGTLDDIRSELLSDDYVKQLFDGVEQYPEYTPHVTIGYPEKEPYDDVTVPENISFDRLAIWYGDSEGPEFLLQADDQPEDETPDSDLGGDSDPLDPSMLGPMQIHGVLSIEGKASGDYRTILDKTTTVRALPTPLRWVKEDVGGHDGAVTVARIEKVWRDSSDDGSSLIRFEGTLDDSVEAQEVLRLIAERFLRGVSVDLDDVELAEDDPESDQMFMTGRIAAATIVQIPAFQEAYVALGPWSESVDNPESPNFIAPEDRTGVTAAALPADVGVPGERGRGWITNPEDTSRLWKYWTRGEGAAKIGWGTPNDFYRCRRHLAKYVDPIYLNRTCAEWHHDAIGVWPGQHSVVTAEMSEDAIVASAVFDSGVKPSKSWFENPNLSEPTPLTVTDDGRVFGHVASWGVCHVGVGGSCLLAPHNRSNYSFFNTGVIDTDDGEVSVGTISMGGNHASLDMPYSAALSHYSSTSTAAAYVHVGEDQYGIWMAGMVSPTLSKDDVFKLKAAGTVSGDWRPIGKGSSQELMAVLAVNSPGFPIPRPSIVASGDMVGGMTGINIVDEQTVKEARRRKARASIRRVLAFSVIDKFRKGE